MKVHYATDNVLACSTGQSTLGDGPGAQGYTKFRSRVTCKLCKRTRAFKASIQAIEEPPCAETVRILESLLAQAKTGEVAGVAVAYVMRGRITGSVFSGGQCTADIYLAIERLKLRLLKDD